MRDEIRAKFEKVLAADQKTRRESERAAQDRLELTRAAAAAWAYFVSTELERAMLPIAAMLKENGWICSIRSEGQSASVLIYRDNMTSAGSSDRPNLKFTADRNNKITIVQATQLRIGTDQQNYRLEDITPDFFQDRVLQFFEVMVAGR
jgi:exopolyphosphatase/pppGpp-phosphohydrolase